MRRLLALPLVLLAVSASGSASAVVATESAYSKIQAYSAALRYLRVDLGFEVTEKDPEAAYLLFRYPQDGKKTPTSGSIEIVERREGVRVVVRLPELPRYQEQVLSEGLVRKLETEYGDPGHKDEPAPAKPGDGDKGAKKDGAARSETGG